MECKYGYGCAFSVSVKNTLREPITNVRYLIVFYDSHGDPIETFEGRAPTYGTIRPGLAVRERGSVGTSVRRLVSRYTFRVLDFAMAP